MSDEIKLVSEILSDTYKSSNGSKIEIIKIASDVVMASKEMAKMFGVGVPTISKKLKKLFTSGELVEKRVSSILTHKATDGKLYRTTFYSSQVIIRVGAMLKSPEVEMLQNWIANTSQA